MRFKGLDLNLLVALDSLLTERTLTEAARRINLSQPAMSAAVSRLRAYFGDELFAMRGRRLVPTSRALRLAAPVREALLQIHLSIILHYEFNPAESDRRFVIRLSDCSTLVLFQKVVERVSQSAPNVRFELLPPADDHDELLRRGEVDFIILPDTLMSSAHPKAKLFEDRLVCVGCRTNKQLSRRLTFERYLSTGQVAVRCTPAGTSAIEECFFFEHGLKRRVEVAVQSFSMVPPMLLGTGRIGMLPLRLVKHLERTTPLRIVDLPFPLPAFTETIQWPTFHNSDPASTWMRAIILQEASCMAPPDDSTQASSPAKAAPCVSSPTPPNDRIRLDPQ
ncbi:LysR family transcriptional regulator [Bradyrhizobium macuxiense]|uniref:LysR family transcriptional regulator n=1 Tax=Bradyrhizobium macuxiense TaxID=1755647 RepID=UPI0009E9F50C|nr:LysR family transcriptional regulator [Bradyrhizobium macuxiense]